MDMVSSALAVWLSAANSRWQSGQLARWARASRCAVAAVRWSSSSEKTSRARWQIMVFKGVEKSKGREVEKLDYASGGTLLLQSEINVAQFTQGAVRTDLRRADRALENSGDFREREFLKTRQKKDLTVVA